MSGNAPVRVVLVDDAVEIRELLGFTLARTSDFTVVAEAADGAAGVQAVADTLPDLVLLDVSMVCLARRNHVRRFSGTTDQRDVRTLAIRGTSYAGCA